MALVLGTLPVRFGITIQDRDSNQGEAVRFDPGIVTLADAVTRMQAFEASVAPLTDGFITGGSISIPLVQDLPFALPPESSDIERKGTFQFRLTNGRVATYTIPSIANTVVTDGSRNGDIAVTQAAVVAYQAVMELGVNGAGQAIDALVRAYKRHRASGRRGA